MEQEINSLLQNSKLKAKVRISKLVSLNFLFNTEYLALIPLFGNFFPLSYLEKNFGLNCNKKPSLKNPKIDFIKGGIIVRYKVYCNFFNLY